MKRSLRRIRTAPLTWTQLGGVLAASVLATGLVIATALGRTGTQSRAIALLSRPRVERVLLVRRPAAPAPVPVSQAPEPAPSPTSVAAGASAPVATQTTTTSTTTTTTPSTSAPVASKVKHVFVIALTTPSYRAAFGPRSTMPYLDHKLRPKGDLLTGYETLGATDLPDYLAIVSGQAPNADTERGCTTYSSFSSKAAPNKAGEVAGRGCVYPNTVVTVGDQLDAHGTGWKGYFEDMGTGLPATQQSCQHPNSDAVDTTLAPAASTAPAVSTTSAVSTTPAVSTTLAVSTTPAASATPAPAVTTTPTGAATTTTAGAAPVPDSGYATTQNPFVYFHSLLDLGDCASDDLPLTRLSGGLHSAAHAPSLVYIAPGLCDDGSGTRCPGAASTGPAAADAFLERWVPMVLRSPAYRKNGVLVIVFASSRAQLAAGASFGHPVRTGALVISRYAKAASISSTRYTPYSVLRSIEDLFALTPLAHAKTAKSFATAALPGAWVKTG